MGGFDGVVDAEGQEEGQGQKKGEGKLLTIEQVGRVLNGVWFIEMLSDQREIGVCRLERGGLLTLAIVPVNLKDRDAFHLTIEEYLQALISLVEELVSPVLLSPSTVFTDVLCTLFRGTRVRGES